MRAELWGLKDKETQKLVLTYWASSQKHKALFSTKEKAEDACKYNPRYEPFLIEAEPVVHCKDCKHFGGVITAYTCRLHSTGYTRIQMQENDFCSYGERRE